MSRLEMMMRAEDILKEDQTNAQLGGMDVRKGTVAAFVANARTWSDPSTSDADREQVERDIRDAVPALKAVGIFDVMSLRDPKLEQLIASPTS